MCPAAVRAAVLHRAWGHYENDSSHSGCGAIARDCYIPWENHNPTPYLAVGLPAVHDFFQTTCAYSIQVYMYAAFTASNPFLESHGGNPEDILHASNVLWL